MLFTAKEKKNLKTLPSRAVDPEAFNLEELHGFLTGLAIMPEMIKPSEWLPVAFGEEIMEFKSSKETTAMSKDPVISSRHDQYQKIGRNDPCPCGRGKKFKKYCGIN